MNKIKFGIRNKMVFLTASLVLITSLTLGYIFFQHGKEHLVQEDLKSLEESIKLYISHLNTTLENLKQNVQFLAGMPPVNGIIRSRANGGTDPVDGSSEKAWRDRLAIIFEKFLLSKPDYLSLRYIGVAEDGKEIIRVDRNKSSINRIFEKDLQSKGHRPYFKETIVLNRGNVYSSEISLNQEHGKISTPYLPVIRVATPIFDDNGIPFGIIVANLDLSESVFNQKFSRFQFYVTNHLGDYLSHPNINKTFGFDKGKRYLMQNEFSGTKKIFDPKNPIQEDILYPMHDGKSNALYFTKMQYNKFKPRNFLVVAMAESYENLTAGTTVTLYQFGMVMVGVILISLIMTLWFARKLTRPVEQLVWATEELAQGKDNIAFPENKGDELGILADSLKTMDCQIRQRTSELQDTEVKLRSTMEQNDMILNAAGEGIYGVDLEGCITFINPVGAHMLGYEVWELSGKNMPELTHSLKDGIGSHPTEKESLMHTSLNEGNIIKVSEIFLCKKDGTQIPVEYTFTPIKKEGDHVGAVVTFKNISERKETEKKIQKNLVDLEEANKALESFTYSASHDLQEPLRKIIMFSDRLKKSSLDHLEDGERNYLDRIQKAAFRMKNLIEDLLGYSQSTFTDLKYERLDLNELVREVVDDLEIQIETTKGQVRYEDLPNIEADRIQMRQLFQNLISNGLKYHQPKCPPEIKIKSVSNGNGCIEISVQDNGIGFEDKYLEKIFQPFKRLHSDSDIAGSGMGLFICKTIVGRHHGTLFVKSQPQKGTTFTIGLPKVQTA